MEGGAILTNRSWKIVHIEKVILIASLIGLISTVWEKDTGISSLGSNLEKIWGMNIDGFQSDLSSLIKFILGFVVIIKALTKEIYVASYLVMILAYLYGNKQIVMPWIIFCGIRSLFAEAVSCFIGCAICANYSTIKYPCLDYVITKGFNLACSACLWTIVYESYMAESLSSITRGRNSSVSSSIQARSLESVLAEAVVDWFIEEAERCRKFDSKMAVDEDIERFEEGITQRAARFLELKPEEILEDVRFKFERKRTVVRIQHSTQTGLDQNENRPVTVEEDLKSDAISEGAQTISEFDMENKNPLRRFAYLPATQNVDSLSKDSEEFNENTALGNKCVSVQTFEPFLDTQEPTIVLSSEYSTDDVTN